MAENGIDTIAADQARDEREAEASQEARDAELARREAPVRKAGVAGF